MYQQVRPNPRVARRNSRSLKHPVKLAERKNTRPAHSNTTSLTQRRSSDLQQTANHRHLKRRAKLLASWDPNSWVESKHWSSFTLSLQRLSVTSCCLSSLRTKTKASHNRKVTDYYPIRRSNRKTKSDLKVCLNDLLFINNMEAEMWAGNWNVFQNEEHKLIDDIIRSGAEEGMQVMCTFCSCI